jgi:hypothetical protein
MDAKLPGEQWTKTRARSTWKQVLDFGKPVRAGLRILDAEEKCLGAASFPPGSLRHLYTGANNRAERRTAKASTLKVEAE